jgi:hypothetical protein
LYRILPAGKASDYVAWLKDLVKRHRKRWGDRPLYVVVYLRESPGKSSRKPPGALSIAEKIERQKRIVLRKLKRLGVQVGVQIQVLKVFRDPWTSGWFDPDLRPEYWRQDRVTLVQAADYARKHTPPGQEPVVVAWNTPRFVRPYLYRPKFIDMPRGLPTDEDYQRLKGLCPGVTLATLMRPDAPPIKVRSEETKGGMHESGNMGGRPSKAPSRRHRPKNGWKDFWEKYLPVARRMRERGRPYWRIAYHISWLEWHRHPKSESPTRNLSENTIRNQLAHQR